MVIALSALHWASSCRALKNEWQKRDFLTDILSFVTSKPNYIPRHSRKELWALSWALWSNFHHIHISYCRRICKTFQEHTHSSHLPVTCPEEILCKAKGKKCFQKGKVGVGNAHEVGRVFILLFIRCFCSHNSTAQWNHNTSTSFDTCASSANHAAWFPAHHPVSDKILHANPGWKIISSSIVLRACSIDWFTRSNRVKRIKNEPALQESRFGWCLLQFKLLLLLIRGNNERSFSSAGDNCICNKYA